MERAVTWSSGVGILAWEEVAGYADEYAEFSSDSLAHLFP